MNADDMAGVVALMRMTADQLERDLEAQLAATQATPDPRLARKHTRQATHEAVKLTAIQGGRDAG